MKDLRTFQVLFEHAIVQSKNIETVFKWLELETNFVSWLNREIRSFTCSYFKLESWIVSSSVWVMIQRQIYNLESILIISKLLAGINDEIWLMTGLCFLFPNTTFFTSRQVIKFVSWKALFPNQAQILCLGVYFEYKSLHQILPANDVTSGTATSQHLFHIILWILSLR